MAGSYLFSSNEHDTDAYLVLDMHELSVRVTFRMQRHYFRVIMIPEADASLRRWVFLNIFGAQSTQSLAAYLPQVIVRRMLTLND